MNVEPVPRIERVASPRRTSEILLSERVNAGGRADAEARPKPVNSEKGRGDGAQAATSSIKNSVNIPNRTYVCFTVDEKSNMVVIKIVDAATQQVVREIPPEVLVKLAQDEQAYQNLGAERQRLTKSGQEG
jgi:flagellar protein FlaG